MGGWLCCVEGLPKLEIVKPEVFCTSRKHTLGLAILQHNDMLEEDSYLL